MSRLMIGYWRPLTIGERWEHDSAVLPDPRELIDHSWNPEDKRRIVEYLRHGRTVVTYMGYSYCRFSCGVPYNAMGTSEMTDGVWSWPEGLAHYVEVHSVRLPSDFMSHARSHRFAIPRDLDVSALGNNYDLTFWITWGRRQTLGTSGATHLRDT